MWSWSQYLALLNLHVGQLKELTSHEHGCVPAVVLLPQPRIPWASVVLNPISSWFLAFSFILVGCILQMLSEKVNASQKPICETLYVWNWISLTASLRGGWSPSLPDLFAVHPACFWVFPLYPLRFWLSFLRQVQHYLSESFPTFWEHVAVPLLCPVGLCFFSKPVIVMQFCWGFSGNT